MRRTNKSSKLLYRLALFQGYAGFHAPVYPLYDTVWYGLHQHDSGTVREKSASCKDKKEKENNVLKNLKEDYFNPFFSHIYVEKSVRNHARTQNILAKFPSAQIIEIGHLRMYSAEADKIFGFSTVRTEIDSCRQTGNSAL